MISCDPVPAFGRKPPDADWAGVERRREFKHSDWQQLAMAGIRNSSSSPVRLSVSYARRSGMGSVTALLFRAVTLLIPLRHACRSILRGWGGSLAPVQSRHQLRLGAAQSELLRQLAGVGAAAGKIDCQIEALRRTA